MAGSFNPLLDGNTLCRNEFAIFVDKTLARTFNLGIRNGNCGKQRLGVGILRIVEDFLGLTVLHNLTKVHNGNGIGNMPDNRKVMRNKEVGDLQLNLKVFKQVNDAGLNGNIKRSNGLVQQQNLRICCKGARNGNTLTLAA